MCGPVGFTHGKGMSYAKQSLPENQEQVKSPSVSPSLVNISHSSASGGWSRQQKRCFQRLNSFILEAQGRGCQLYRVDLTTSPAGDRQKLRKHLQELRRRIERRWGIWIEMFIVETGEGFGVLHMVWAIKCERPVFIPQAWLSDEWLEIHGAFRVWISRMGGGRNSVKRVSRYFSSQYLSGQCEIVRVSWSWWRARVAIASAWMWFKGELRKSSEASTWVGINPNVITIGREAMIKGWEKLLLTGWCTLGQCIYFISGRSIDVGFVDKPVRVVRYVYSGE